MSVCAIMDRVPSSPTAVTITSVMRSLLGQLPMSPRACAYKMSVGLAPHDDGVPATAGPDAGEFGFEHVIAYDDTQDEAAVDAEVGDKLARYIIGLCDGDATDDTLVGDVALALFGVAVSRPIRHRNRLRVRKHLRARLRSNRLAYIDLWSAVAAADESWSPEVVTFATGKYDQWLADAVGAEWSESKRVTLTYFIEAKRSAADTDTDADESSKWKCRKPKP